MAATDQASAGGERTRRAWAALIVMALIGVAATLGLAALGAWQIERRTWKLDLIAHVEQRLAAAPVGVPLPAAWVSITRSHDEYRRVAIRGRFLGIAPAFVTASTELGPGYWMMSPMRDHRGFTVMINRGYVPLRDVDMPAASNEVRIVGLLRMTEPRGGLLRTNDPAAGRWYSRDVRAIADTLHLPAKDRVAPFFIDAEATPGGRYPRGGLTIVSFPNNHLAYALTWFALAGMAAGATIFLLRQEWRPRTPR